MQSKENFPDFSSNNSETRDRKIMLSSLFVTQFRVSSSFESMAELLACFRPPPKLHSRLHSPALDTLKLFSKLLRAKIDKKNFLWGKFKKFWEVPRDLFGEIFFFN